MLNDSGMRQRRTIFELMKVDAAVQGAFIIPPRIVDCISGGGDARPCTPDFRLEGCKYPALSKIAESIGPGFYEYPDISGRVSDDDLCRKSI